MNIITRIGPGFKYRFRDTLRGLVTFTAIVLAVLISSGILAVTDSGVGAVFTGGFELAAAITLFIYGICTIREDLRLANQCGRGRISAYIVNLLTMITMAILLAIVGEVVVTLMQYVMKNVENIEVATMYQQLMEVIGSAEKAAAARHIESVVLSFSFCAAASCAGVFLSAMFYRLNKLWTTVAAIALAACVLYIVPMILSRIYRVSEAFRNFLSFLVEDEMHIAAAMMVCAAIVCVINWLLVRRAPIRAAGER